VILLATGFYFLKIVSTALSIESEIKGMANDLKSKIGALSITFAGLVALLEKFIQYKRESRKDDDDSEGREEREGSEGRKGPKKIKIAKIDEE
jgi:hypothetical protein